MTQAQLYDTARQWEQRTVDQRDYYNYTDLLDELSFHAALRFSDYIQYQHEHFFVRVADWLNNVKDVRHQQALLQLLGHLFFVDADQMTALYRDAFRRVISPWLASPPPSIDEMLAPNFQEQQRRALTHFQIAAVTESCDTSLLLNASDLHGLPRPVVLGPNVAHALSQVDALPGTLDGLIICEDIVGSGEQAGRILRAVEQRARPSWRLLFVPLIAFESGVKNMEKHYLRRTNLRPVVIIPERQCLRKDPAAGEPQLFKMIRGIVKTTAQRVLVAFDELDDPPTDAFGYENSGGLVVTCHNAPNNTLPLVHHKAPMWTPLFRRLHHKERT